MDFLLGNDHLKGQKLNELYTSYANGNQWAVSDAVNLLASYIRDVAVAAENKTGIPAEDFESHMMEALARAFETFSQERGASFAPYASKLITRAMVDVKTNRAAGGHGTYVSRVSLGSRRLKNEEEDGEQYVSDVKEISRGDGYICVGGTSFPAAGFDELTDPMDVESSVINRLTLDDSRDVIISIANNAKPKESKILSVVYRHLLEGGNFNTAARELGVPASTVTRTLERLGKYYNTHKFGDARDYLDRTERMKAGKKTNGTPIPRADVEAAAEAARS